MIFIIYALALVGFVGLSFVGYLAYKIYLDWKL